MPTCSDVILMAAYNRWMNAKVYAAAGRLPAHELAADRHAFFGSIIGTLNHIVVADTIWLHRLAAHPSNHAVLDPVRRMPRPAALDLVLFGDLHALENHRQMLDEVIIDWAASLTEADLRHVLSYANMKGVPARKRFSNLVMHFFNHQTHHRGQVTTLLFQAGQDVGVTDLLETIPDEAPA